MHNFETLKASQISSSFVQHTARLPVLVMKLESFRNKCQEELYVESTHMGHVTSM